MSEQQQQSLHIKSQVAAETLRRIAKESMTTVTTDPALPKEFNDLENMFYQQTSDTAMMQEYLKNNRLPIATLASSRCDYMKRTPEQTQFSNTVSTIGAAFMFYASSLQPPDSQIQLGPLLSPSDLRMDGFGKVDLNATVGKTGEYIEWLENLALTPKAVPIGRDTTGRRVYGISATFANSPHFV